MRKMISASEARAMSSAHGGILEEAMEKIEAATSCGTYSVATEHITGEALDVLEGLGYEVTDYFKGKKMRSDISWN